VGRHQEKGNPRQGLFHAFSIAESATVDAKAESDWLPATPPAPGFGRGFIASIQSLPNG
jgi:hypothetical protein